MHQTIVEAWLEAWSGGNLDDLDAIVAPDFVRFAPTSLNMVTHSLTEIKEAITAYRTAFPDARITLGEIVGQDDRAFYRWTQTGTNTGPGDFPPTGKTMDITGVCFARFRDGMMIEEFGYFDVLDFMVQLGLMKSPGGDEA
jgi:steroid delta-isomerase-like uncharacterized protein